MRASLQYISDLTLHSLLQPLLCAYSTLRLQRTACHSQILKDSVSCWHLPLHGMSSPTHSTRSSSNVTSSVDLSSQFSPVPSPCFIPNKLLLPQYLQRKYQMKKSLLNIYYLNILVLGRQKCISQVLLWNSEFIWGRTRANQ